MEMNLANRVAIVTARRKGIGEAIFSDGECWCRRGGHRPYLPLPNRSRSVSALWAEGRQVSIVMSRKRLRWAKCETVCYANSDK